MYLLPLLEVTGKRPVWSVEILPDRSIHFIVTRFVRICGPGEGSAFVITVGEGVSVGWGFVLRMCWRIIFRWPWAEWMELGRCFLTSWEVRPGQVEKKSVSMALIQVSGTGDHAHRCRYVAKSTFVRMS